MAVPPEMEVDLRQPARTPAPAARSWQAEAAGGLRPHRRHRHDGRALRGRRHRVIPRVNLGGIHHRPGRTRTAALRLPDRRGTAASSMALDAAGVEVTAQDLPDVGAGAAAVARMTGTPAPAARSLLVWGTIVGLDLVSVPQGLLSRPLVAGGHRLSPAWCCRGEAGDSRPAWRRGRAGALRARRAAGRRGHAIPSTARPPWPRSSAALGLAAASRGWGGAWPVGLVRAVLGGWTMQAAPPGQRPGDPAARGRGARGRRGQAIRRLQWAGSARDVARSAGVTAFGIAPRRPSSGSSSRWAREHLRWLTTAGGRRRAGRGGRRRGPDGGARRGGWPGSPAGAGAGILVVVAADERAGARPAAAPGGAGRLELRAHARCRHGLRRRAAAGGPRRGRPRAHARGGGAVAPSSSTATLSGRPRAGRLGAGGVRGVPGAQIQRLRTALCSPLGALGDQLFWAGLVPVLMAARWSAVALGAAGGPWSGVRGGLQCRPARAPAGGRCGPGSARHAGRRGHFRLLAAARVPGGSAAGRGVPGRGWRCRWSPLAAGQVAAPVLVLACSRSRSVVAVLSARFGARVPRSVSRLAAAAPDSALAMDGADDRARGDDRESAGAPCPAGRPFVKLAGSFQSEIEAGQGRHDGQRQEHHGGDDARGRMRQHASRSGPTAPDAEAALDALAALVAERVRRVVTDRAPACAASGCPPGWRSPRPSVVRWGFPDVPDRTVASRGGRGRDRTGCTRRSEAVAASWTGCGSGCCSGPASRSRASSRRRS